MNLHHRCDLRSQRVNGDTAIQASSFRLRGFCDRPRAFLSGHGKHWMVTARRHPSQVTGVLDGRPKTTVGPAQSR